ncbi:HAD family hydrolase [Candidatus Leptofilum sp.]|uniref:HAD family hydrolase n=1 Tax=Candidatus Leptofilum sp. TaxID=3241576 RepID=UPI003B5CCA3B
MQFTTLLFDLDGTLTDPKVGITQSIRYALDKMERPYSPNASLDWCIGPPLQESFAILLQNADPVVGQEALRLFRERFSTVGLFENEPYPDIHHLLAQLQAAGLKLYIATSKPAVYARRIVAHFDLAPYFLMVYGSELDGRFTHKNELIQHVLHTENLNPAHTLMIGDRKHDILGAKANHVTAVGVTWGYGSSEELRAAGADKLLHQPTELLHFLNLA